MEGEEVMKKANWQAVLEETEWVAIVTSGSEGPHVVATWGEYVRCLSESGSEVLVVPAGYYNVTEENFKRNKVGQVMIASRKVAGSYGPGQGYLLQVEGELQSEGDLYERVKSRFEWARGALVLKVVDAQAQL